MSQKRRGQMGEGRSRRLHELLGDLARMGGEANVGAMQFIDLASLAEFLEDSAPDRVAALSEVALEVLNDQIKDPDIFYQQSGTRFTMIFINRDDAAAERKVEACRMAILERMKVDHGIEDFYVEVDVKQLTAEELLEQSQAYLAQCEIDDHSEVEADMALGRSERLELSFRPFWRAPKGVIGTFGLSARRVAADGTAAVGYSAIAGTGDLRKVASYDTSMLGFAEKEIEAGIARGEKFVISTPLFYPAYADPILTEQYRARLARISPDVRRRLCLQVIGVSSRAEGRHLILNLNSLAQHCQAVMAHLPLKHEGFIALQGSGVSVLGTSVYGLDMEEDPIETRLENFVRAVAQYKTPLYLTGVDNEEIARMALNLGFEFLSGPFISNDQPKPSAAEVQPFETLIGMLRSYKRKEAEEAPEAA